MRGEDQLGDFVSMWKENMKMVLNEMSCVGGGGGMDTVAGFCEHGDERLGPIEGREDLLTS
jgi:hypothetical protein